MFPGVRKQIDLALIESRQLEGGCVYVLYRVKGTEPAATPARRARRKNIAERST
jgi:hypothetical protein